MFTQFFSLAEPYIWIAAPVGTLILSALLTKAVLHFFPQWQLLDRPEKYGHDRAPIPYPGGIAIVFGFLIVLFLLFPLDLQLLGFVGGIVLLAVVSFQDDRHGMPPLIRLGVQAVLGVIVFFTGTKIVFISNPFGSVAFEFAPWLSLLVTIGWIITMINTLNWLDGVSGVAAGTSTIAGIFLGLLSLTPTVDQPILALMCFVFSAANFGFFWWNIPPPKMLNGDTGAMFSGFVIAVLAIFSGGKIATAFLVCALPLFDAFSVIFHRLRQGRSPWSGNDKLHLHDQLFQRGFSQRKIMWIFLSISLFLGMSALYLQTLGKITFLAILGIAVFSLSWKNAKKKPAKEV